MALLFSCLDLKSEVSTLGLGPNTVTVAKPRRCRAGRWLQEVTCVVPPLRQSQIDLDHPWWVSLSFVSAVRPFFRHLNDHCSQSFPSPRVWCGTWGWSFPRHWMVQQGETVALPLQCRFWSGAECVDGGQRSGRWETAWVRFGTEAQDMTGVYRGNYFDYLTWISSPDN